MPSRRGVSIIETLVVFAIIGLMLGLLLPVLQSTRQRALELGCKNNLRQINLAIADFAVINKHIPGPGISGHVGGWTIDVLPFLGQQNLRASITPGMPISTAPDFLMRQPGIFRCPVRNASGETKTGAMEASHYVFIPISGRKSYGICDAPLAVNLPWASGPEMSFGDVFRQTGPHNRGFFYASGFQQGVDFRPGGQ